MEERGWRREGTREERRERTREGRREDGGERGRERGGERMEEKSEGERVEGRKGREGQVEGIERKCEGWLKGESVWGRERKTNVTSCAIYGACYADIILFRRAYIFLRWFCLRSEFTRWCHSLVGPLTMLV